MFFAPMQETREIMTQHLAFAKWKESAFSTEQLKGVRWLLGARPRGLPEALLEPLTMTPMAQSMMMQLHVKKFLQDTRRVKASAKKFVRASQEDFDKLSDYACIFAYLRQAAKVATSDSKVDDKLLEAFMARSLDVKSILYLCSARVTKFQKIWQWFDQNSKGDLMGVYQAYETSYQGIVNSYTVIVSDHRKQLLSGVVTRPL